MPVTIVRKSSKTTTNVPSVHENVMDLVGLGYEDPKAELNSSRPYRPQVGDHVQIVEKTLPHLPYDIGDAGIVLGVLPPPFEVTKYYSTDVGHWSVKVEFIAPRTKCPWMVFEEKSLSKL